MASVKSKIICAFMAVALVVSLFPIASYANAREGEVSNVPDNSGSTSSALSLPTEEQLEDAAPNQLIVTYVDDEVDMDDSIEVAELDGGALSDIATSEPSEQTTLSDMGATNSELIVEQDDDGDQAATSLVTFEDGTDLQEAAAQLLSSPEVESVQPNFEYELFATIGSTSYHDQTATSAAKHPTNDPYSYVNSALTLNQNYIYTTKVADAWDAGYKTNGSISVAVIDAGFRLDHPDLQPSWDLTYARDFSTTQIGTGYPYTDSPSYWTGKTGNECHGTWVSGIISAAANNQQGIAGTSYNAKIIPLKVTDGRTFYTSTLVRAYDYLDTLVESGKVPSLKVINLSLGGKQSDTKVKTAIDHMYNSHNILTVASAGNYGDNAGIYPSDYSNVLSVMSVNPDLTRASFSNYGTGKNISAPGTNITTTIPYSSTWGTSATGKYSKSGITGTSFSAPIVSGIAALCYAVKPTATAAEVKSSITIGAHSLKSIDSTCAPYVDALQAVKNVISGAGLYDATHTSISAAKVSAISKKYYTGKRKIPRPKVTLNGKTLKRGTDYTLTYSNNLLPGKATITIKAKGAYKGTKTVKFNILPKATKITKLKAGRRSMTVKWTSRKACASGYIIRYSASSKRNSSKKLKTGRNVVVSGKSKTSKTITRLKSKKRYYVQVRTYRLYKGVKYCSKWSALKKVVAR